MRNHLSKSLLVSSLLLLLTANACAAPANPTPAPLPTVATIPTVTPVAAVPTLLPTAILPTPTVAEASHKTFRNDEFGLSFQYPSDWFGPEAYVSDGQLRVEVGSDNVYPYGTDPTARVQDRPDSYYVVIQFTKNNQNDYWKEAYETVGKLKDGESVSSARSLLIKVRDLEFGKFKGLEYISTLPTTAQTEPVYIRQVVLVDEQSNLLTVMGQPNNVARDEGETWVEAYQAVDTANRELFDSLVGSLAVN